MLQGKDAKAHSLKRQYCPKCDYPVRTCVCFAINAVHCDLQINIMQDPSESRHAKNTARLLPLLLKHASIYVGESEADFAPLREKLKTDDKSLLIFPTENAVKLHQLSPAENAISQLILLDGSWRKAKKLWHNNPWLHKLKSASIEHNDISNYHIRKRPFANSLSTIEAAAISLEHLRGISTAPFDAALDALQSHWPTSS